MSADIKPKSTKGLTSRQLMFIAEYVRHNGSGYKAALALGIDPKTASSTAAQWLDERRFPLVAAEAAKQLAAVLEAKRNEAVITGRDVLTKMAHIINFNPQDLFDENGNLVPVKQLPPEVACCIQRLKIRKRTTTKGDEVEVVTENADVDCYSVVDASRLALQAMGILKEGTVNVNNNANAVAQAVNWDSMGKESVDPQPDPIEAKIAEVEQLPPAQLDERTTTNGQSH